MSKNSYTEKSSFKHKYATAGEVTIKPKIKITFRENKDS